MKKVLVITYYWPPGSGPGVQRWLKFTKFLPEYGWSPTVLTVENGSYPSIDESLVSEIPEQVKVIKTRSLEPFKIFNLLKGEKGNQSPVAMGGMHKSKSLVSRIGLWVRANYFIPDARMGWNYFAQTEAAKLVRNGGFDAVITTGPPHSTHLIGKKLQTDLGIKWIADFRDPWTTIYYNQYLPRTEKATQKDQNLENTVLSNADVLLTVSPGMQAEFQHRASQTEVLFNGFDDDDFGLEAEPAETFNLAYIGNFKDNQNVETLWQAIIELRAEDEVFKDDFRLQITGNVVPSLDQMLQEKLQNSYQKFDFVPHREAVKQMKSAGALLFIIPNSANNEVILTGKIFEYLASGTPMLSIGPVNGNAAEIVEECNQLQMVDYSNLVKIKSNIRELYHKFKSKEPRVRSAKVATYSRKGQTEKLAKLLQEITHEH